MASIEQKTGTRFYTFVKGSAMIQQPVTICHVIKCKDNAPQMLLMTPKC